MRIRPYPAAFLILRVNDNAGGFLVLLLAAAYLGLTPSTIPTRGQSDKVLHFATFFLLTLCFYWILDTNRRRTLQFTLFICLAVLGIGSEIVQGLLPNGRDFDLFDILANIAGSLAATALCSWYHKRMLERKRQAKSYQVVPGEELDDRDVELGGVFEGQEIGATSNAAPAMNEEVDTWDENDWENDEPESPDDGGHKTPSSSVGETVTDSKKGSD